MRDHELVRFEPVDPRDGSPQETPEGSLEDAAIEPATERLAERDRFPLAGPILEEASSRVLRGRCSSCDARLRIRLDGEGSGPVLVRCPICGNTRQVDV